MGMPSEKKFELYQTFFTFFHFMGKSMGRAILDMKKGPFTFSENPFDFKWYRERDSNSQGREPGGF